MLVGVVGKPNVGKSTFFKASTLAEAEIANYPFATIKPNSGVGFVKVDCAKGFWPAVHSPNGLLPAGKTVCAGADAGRSWISSRCA